MRSNLRVMAQARPAALPVPADRRVSAFTKPDVFDKWGEDAAGVRALSSGDNVITMFDIIGEDFWSGGGVTAKKVAAQLRAIGDRPVTVQINSPGGDMFEGIAIYNVLREHPQPVTVQVMAMAASAASIIAMAGDTIEIGSASFLMIHNCWVLAMGNQFDLREVADWLEPFDTAMVGLYAQRSGRDEKQIAAWMKAETYMSGATAIERGFADALLPAEAMKADPSARETDRALNEKRGMEIALLAQNYSRTEARAKINRLSGTTDSAGAAGTLDSASTIEWLPDAAALLNSLRA